ncbi:hypothetical protein NLX71_10045 [Paenibacillus sp. MZ04-78.2]|uniref:hypothetical protein n=1 Tax=Paenibacillus sp. MZ04-78.2 TaxID=2962034 RepID=UPI0020B725F4|nr:hypothetical protein [Paenibacillus sp. MZ04-78.2]MCP3773651.1 hypothetical protein [Paenibacillus sp. MZ04-78.2]
MTNHVQNLESANAAQPVNPVRERRQVAAKTVKSSKAEQAYRVQAGPGELRQSVTLEMLRTKLAGLVQAGRQCEIRALLRHYGAERLPDVPTKYFDELLHAAEKLG